MSTLGLFKCLPLVEKVEHLITFIDEIDVFSQRSQRKQKIVICGGGLTAYNI